MATPLENAFQQWSLSAEEQVQGSLLQDLQKKVIQNEIAIAAQEKLALKFDSGNPLLFAQQEAELAGKIGILSFLLQQSELAAETLRNSNQQ